MPYIPLSAGGAPTATYTPLVAKGVVPSAPPTPAPTGGYVPLSSQTAPASPATPAAPAAPTFQGAGYGASNIKDISGKPLLTYENEAAKSSQLLSDRTALPFDFTKPQKITKDMLDNGRMPESMSKAIKDSVGGTAAQELDHIMPLELGGSNEKSNLQLEANVPGTKNTPTDPIENQLARKAMNGEISVLDAWRQMAKAKNLPLKEDQQPQAGGASASTSGFNVGRAALEEYPGTTQTLAELQIDPASLKADPHNAIMDAWNNIKGSVMQEGQNINDLFSSLSSEKTPAERIGAGLKTVAGAAGIVFSPITALFSAANDIPVLGSVSKLISLPFQFMGESGANTAKLVVSKLPIPQDAKDKISPGVEQIFALAGQLALGKISADMLPEKKAALETKFGPEDAKTIVDTAQKMAEQKATVAPSGEAGFVNPAGAIQGVKETAANIKVAIEKSKETSVTANNVDEGLRQIGNQNRSDNLRFREAYKNADLTPEEQKQLFEYRQDTTKPVSEKVKQANDQIISPIKDEQARIISKLKGQGIPVDDTHNTRITLNRGSYFDRLANGEEAKTSSGGLLTKSSPGLKRRVMMAVEDDAGNRKVVSIKKGAVTAWEDGKPTSLGGLNLATNEARLRGETAPIDAKTAKLQSELDTLTATKGRAEASPERIQNIKNQMADLSNRRASIEDKYNPEKLDNKVFTDNTGKPGKLGKAWTITQAKESEIEANTGVRYSHYSLANEMIRLEQLRNAERASDWLESFKTNPEFSQIAVKFGEKNIPEGWKTVDAPQFRGYAFEPRVANDINRYFRSTNDDGLISTQKLNLYVRNVSLFNPVYHGLVNVLPNWFAARGGVSFVNPAKYLSGFRSGVDAIRAVMNPLEAPSEGMPSYTDLLDHNATLNSSHNLGTLSDEIRKNVGQAIESNPSLGKKIDKSLGNLNPIRWLDYLIGRKGISAKATFISEDVARLELTYERIRSNIKTGMTKDVATEEAVKNTDKIFPTNRISEGQYNIASKLVGRDVVNAISRPDVTLYAGYHASLLQTLANNAKDLLGKVPLKDRAAAADRIVGLVIGLTVLYPAYDKLLQFVTGNPKAEAKRGGVFAPIENTIKLAQGKEGVAQYGTSLMTPAPVTEAAAETLFNTDFFSGQKIVPAGDQGLSLLKDYVGGFGQEVGANVQPFRAGQQIAAGTKNPRDYFLSLIGVNSPKSTPSEVNLSSMLYDERNQRITDMKKAVASGDAKGASDIAAEFNKRLLQNAIDAFKESGHNITDETALRQWLITTGLSSRFIHLPTSVQMSNYTQGRSKSTLQKVLK
jgi:hypothetical protein